MFLQVVNWKDVYKRRLSSPLILWCKNKNIILRMMFLFLATRNGLEPSTSSVTGWRANRLHHRARYADMKLERDTGVEPAYAAWEAAVLPMN